MANTDVMEKALKSMIFINAALRNIHLYPPASASVVNSIEKACNGILSVLEGRDSLEFTDHDKKLLVCRQMIKESGSEAAQAGAFLEVMQSFSIRNLVFNRGITSEELGSFLELLNEKPEQFEEEGSFEKAVAQKKFGHIDIDIRSYSSSETGSAGQAGVNGGHLVKETFVLMVKTLDEILDGEYKDRIAQQLAISITKKDDEILAMILTQDLGGELGASLVSHIINEMDDERFEPMVYQVRKMRDAAKSAGDDEYLNVLQSAYRNMLQSDKGLRLQKQIKQREEFARTQRIQRMESLKAALNSILRGETVVFRNRDIMNQLPETIEKFFSQKKYKTAAAIIEKLGDGLSIEDDKLRQTVSETTAQITEIILTNEWLSKIKSDPERISAILNPEEAESIKLTDQPEPDTPGIEAERLLIMKNLSPKLLRWVKTQGAASDTLEKIADRMKKLADMYIHCQHTDECVPILEAFNQATGDETVSRIAEDMARLIASDALLDQLINDFTAGDKSVRQEAINYLTRLGTASVGRLLDLLRKSQDRYERSRILQVISDIGPSALPAIIDRINQKAPWYYSRNLVLLVGKTGSEDHAYILVPHLSHKDIRVRREALNSIYMIGGSHREDIFLPALDEADDPFKLDIIGMLGAIDSPNATPKLVEILESKALASSKMRNELVEKICSVLNYIGSTEAIPALTIITEEKKKGLLGRTGFDERVKTAASETLAIISGQKPRPVRVRPSQTTEETEKPEDKTPEKTAPRPVQAANIPTPEKSETPDENQPEKTEEDTDFAEKEQLAKTCIQDGDTDKAVQILYELIVKAVESQQFRKADALRSMMIDADSMALTEIMKSGEIIDKAKSESIDRKYLKTWSALYGTLTPEETNAVFFSLIPKSFSAGQYVFKQGDVDDRLYFIDDGAPALVFSAADEETPVKTLGNGDVVGVDTFLEPSVCTVSFSAKTDTELRIFEKKTMNPFKEELPALEAKIKDFCLKIEKISDVIEKNQLERRANAREERKERIMVSLINASGTPVGQEIRAELTDMSVGGVGFLIKLPEDRATRMFHRRVNMKFRVPQKNKPPVMFEKKGTIVAVTYHYTHNFCFHVRFDKNLSRLIPTA